MKKILIISSDNVDDTEIFYPYYRMTEEGYKVDIASFTCGEFTAKHGYKFNANKALNNLDLSAYSGLILPGGSAPEKLRQNEDTLNAVNYFFKNNCSIAAICHGPQILISAGILKNVKATCYAGIKDDIINAGAFYVDEKAVSDKNIITSRRPEDLPFFMQEFIKNLNKNK